MKIKDFVLSQLEQGPSYGYELSKRYAEFRQAKFYPMQSQHALLKLSSDGVITSYYETEAEASSHGGPRRKMYKLV